MNRPLLFVVSAAVLASCSDYAVRPPGYDPSPPRVVSVMPAVGESTAEFGGPIRADFDDPLLEDTVTSSSFIVRRNGVPVPGAIAVQSSTAAFHVSTALDYLATYSVELTSDIRNRAGLALSTSFMWSFTTRDLAWSPPSSISSPNASRASPRVAVDASGAAFAIWSEATTNGVDVAVRRFTPESGWEAPEYLEFGPNDSGSAEIALDSDGNGTAVWTQNDGTRFNLWSCRYEPTNGWGIPQLLEEINVGSASNPDVAANAAGGAVVVWMQFNGTSFDILARRYVPGFGWAPVEPLESGSGDSVLPQVVVDAQGDAIAVWETDPSGIWANRFDSQADAWEGQARIDSGSGLETHVPRIAANASGRAAVLWHELDNGSVDSIWSNQFLPGTGWGTAQLVEEDDIGNAYYPTASVGSDGTVIAVWQQSDGTRFNVWSNRFVDGTGWGTPRLLETNPGDATSPEVQIDSRGYGESVWIQQVGTETRIFASRLDPSGEWASPLVIMSGADGQVSLAMGTTGWAFASADHRNRAEFEVFVASFR